MKNQEGQTPLDLCQADDVKCLLQDAMPTSLALPTTNKANAVPMSTPRPAIVTVGAAAAVALSGAAAQVATSVVATASIATSTPGASANPPAVPPEPVVMPSGSTFPVVPVASSTVLSTAGAGVGYPMPHPGDGSIDFTKVCSVISIKF